MDDLERLCGLARGRGMSVCVDLVLNHCAAEHEWAVAARAGDPEAEAMFWALPDRELPDAYERTLPEVFPDFAPGNFSFLAETGRWVWTSFNIFQWDLNWSNPRVFTEMRLTCSSTWPTAGSRCCGWTRSGSSGSGSAPAARTSPRSTTCSRRCGPAPDRRPGGGLQGRGDREPDRPGRLPGRGATTGRISDLAYHNSLMAVLVGGGDQDARLATLVLGRLPAKPASTAWATYLRCHDDIGWAASWTRTRPRSAERLRPPPLPGRLLRRQVPPAASPAARCSSRTTP